MKLHEIMSRNKGLVRLASKRGKFLGKQMQHNICAGEKLNYFRALVDLIKAILSRDRRAARDFAPLTACEAIASLRNDLTRQDKAGVLLGGVTALFLGHGEPPPHRLVPIARPKRKAKIHKACSSRHAS